MAYQAQPSCLSRAELLLGEAAMARIAAARVILFGVGGVGSWCAEGLVRSGIRHLTLVDPDCVSETNLNRQLMATVETIGERKVDALRRRLLSINPDAEIIARTEAFSAETAADFDLSAYDVIIDAIDALKDKAFLLLQASAAPGRLYASMGAALKMDPTRIRVAEFWDVRGCPLGAALRKKFRKAGTLPAKRFRCVYDEEVLENRGAPVDPTADPGYAKKAVTNGSLVHITALFGFTLCGLILEDLAKD